MTRFERQLLEEVTSAVWDAAFLVIDGEPNIGGEVAGYIAQVAAEAAERAFRVQFETPAEAGEEEQA